MPKESQDKADRSRLTLFPLIPILSRRHEISSRRISMLNRALFAFLIAGLATFAVAQDAPKAHQPNLTPQNSGTTQLLISVSTVNSRVVWAAGTGGTYVVTTDG